jgi:hypothetical protein
VGPRAGLDTEDRGKILCPCRGSNLDRPVVQPVARHYTDRANPAHNYQTREKETMGRGGVNLILEYTEEGIIIIIIKSICIIYQSIKQ